MLILYCNSAANTIHWRTIVLVVSSHCVILQHIISHHNQTNITSDIERDNIPYHIAANMIRHRLQAHLMNWIGADLQQGTIHKQQYLV